MGKRVIGESNHENHHQHVTPVTTGPRNIRKRKCNSSNLTSIEKGKILRRMNASHNNYWHENDDEDSSSNDGPLLGLLTPRNASSKHANNSSILLNNTLNLNLTNCNDNNSPLTESPKPVYTLRPSIVNGTVLSDLTQKPWRLGRPIGKGNFGEIFLASDNISIPVTNENAKFVVKIEPHSNGPLFVEIHCLMSTATKSDIKSEKLKEEESVAATNIPQNAPSGIPDYIASGSHYFGNARYRFLVLPRFDRDLHSLIRKCRIHQKSVLTLGIQIINVLENLHDTGYCHNDVKAQNLMISKCKYLTQKQQKKSNTSATTESTESYLKANNAGKHIKSSKYDHYEEKQQTTDSGNSSEQEANDDDVEDYAVKRKVYNKDSDRTYNIKADEEDDETDDDDDEHDDDHDEDEDENEEEPEWKQDEDDEDEDFDDGATTNSMNSNSMDTFRTPQNRSKRLNDDKSLTARQVIQYSGSNPVRSCRRDKRNSIYDEMVTSHYLRPTKRVSYSEFFNEDDVSVKGEKRGAVQSNSSNYNTSDDESVDSVPLALRRSVKSTTKKSYINNMNSRRLTRRQEKLLGINNKGELKKRSTEAEVDDKKKLLKAERSEVTQQPEPQWVEVNEERIFLIDYGLASKFIDNGIHRPFVMDQRRAHDGTLEFTSRDAHMGAHSRRSDMECLGYNLLFWSQGYLPWKEAATNQQQEKVHRAKEYLMTDVRELLRQIYGKQVPKYLGEFLHLVGQLAYHERPDYNRYRCLFEKEYQQLGHSLSEMRLQMHEIQRSCVRVKEEIENKNDFFEMDKNTGACNMVLNIMQNLSVGGTPFHERTLSNRVSPKNLRSKTDKKATKKKKFSWAEILSQDPDQIARERADKEFDREELLSEVQQPLVRRYQGKPTYAIMEILNRLGRTVNDYEEETINLERKQQDQQNDRIDECDGGNDVRYHRNDAAAAMKEDEGKGDYNDQSGGDEAETDTTETFEQHSNNTRRRQTSSKRTNTKPKPIKTNSNKTTATRKLILKTPNMTTPTGGKNPSTSSTTVGARTRGKKTTTTKKLKKTPTTTATRTKAKLAKSTTKRGSAIKTGGRKSLSTSDTSSSSSSSASAASATGEVEQQRTALSSKKRERPTRRCLIKTDQTSAGLLEDDSNSNCSPDVKGLLWS